MATKRSLCHRKTAGGVEKRLKKRLVIPWSRRKIQKRPAPDVGQEPNGKSQMKRLLTIAVLLGVTPAALAAVGGEVDFENFNNSLIYTNSVHNGPATGLISGQAGVVNPFQPGSYVFALFAAPTTKTTVDSSLSGWDPAGLSYGVNTATPGLMNGNDDASGPGSTLAGPWGDGETANFVVVGWSANVGLWSGGPTRHPKIWQMLWLGGMTAIRRRAAISE